MKGKVKKIVSLILVFIMTFSVCPQTQIFSVKAEDEDNTPYNLSLDRPVYVSSGSNEDYVVDGKEDTRWQADQSDENEWLYVDLGKIATIDHIYLHWEAAYAKYYDIQVSDDESNWTTVYSKGKNVGAYVNMAISYRYTGEREDGNYRFQLDWTKVEDAHYKVYVDGEIAKSGLDEYSFTDHGDTGGSVRFSPGIEHTVKVEAFHPDTGAELGSGICTFVAEPDASGNNGIEVDTEAELKQTIDASELSKNTGRYVKIITTERATAYGSSLYEFQVYGTGGANKRPVNYGTNLALKQPVECSGTRDEWWMKDEDGNITEDAYNQIKPENAVDGDTSTSFTSYQGEEEQWLYVDLGQDYTVGRIIANFNDDAGKIYDIQVSSDTTNWKTIHRQLRGYSGIKDNVSCYQTNVRYVRVLTYSKVEHGSGFGLRELEVYEYRDGDSKENETIPELPKRQIVNSASGKGSYITGEIKKELNKLPTFVNEETVKVPIDSNSWWSSAMIKTFGNVDSIHPLKAVYSKKGLGVLLASQGFTDERKEEDLGVGYYTERLMDFYVLPDNFLPGSSYDRVEGYGDYSVDLGLCDEDGLKMKSTFVKGSPYVFTEYEENEIVFINSSSITEIFDDNGDTILKNAGDTVITDHLGFKSVDEENARAKNDGSYFAVSAPEGTTFIAMTVGAKTSIKVIFPSKNDTYLSFGAMLKKSDLNTYYRHGYAFVTDTQVDYTYDKNTSKIETTYTVSTKAKRSGFSDVTMQAFYPHQWKHSTDTDNPDAVYGSIRGNMKGKFANVLTTTQQFAGLLPTFAKPESEMFDSLEVKEYLNIVLNQLGTDPNPDAYWQGKAVHPLAISALMAEQIGETEIRDGLLKKLKKIMVDWFTYSGGDDRCYLIYNKDWGTIYYPESSFGANAAICDHHFTYGYFMFGAAVLATYDKEFYNDYKDMIELLVRDYANPEEPENDGNMFCKFRAFDQYSGHSWAGGYADNDDGNNQESASESLFSWVGMYLWGEVTKDQKYIDAGAYGFTTEMDAVEQYWFDYDGDNWLAEYPFEGTGQIYGSSYSYGTFFGGQPLYVYGIQWLPISEYLTNYGMNQEKCKNMYQGLWNDTHDAIDKVLINMNKRVEEYRQQGWSEDQIQAYIERETKTANEYSTPDTGWQHITWPMLSQTDPQAAYDLFEANVAKVQKEDKANTLWFIAAMDQLGCRTTDYVITGDIQGSVYYNRNTEKYTAEVWNPTETTQTITIRKADGTTAGTANIGSGALVSFVIEPDKNFEFSQVVTPVIKATSLLGGTVTDNITGETTFEDTQLVELSCAEEGATIYYTTDGTTPTTSSNVYTDRILVSNNTTVKAIAVKEGFIDSTYASATLIINGDKIESSENLALEQKASASTQNGNNTADQAVDGDLSSRWESSSTDNQYFEVDLGSVQAVNTVKITWEAAYASKYEIQVSTDGKEWSTVALESGKQGEVTTVFDATQARYVRMQGIERATDYGYSIYEFEVYGALQAQAPTISPVSDVYDTEQTVTMSTTVKGAEIKYTLDGSDPTEDSATYVEPIQITKSTIVKAVTFRKGMVLSEITEASIIIAGTIALNRTSATIAYGRTLQLSAITNETVTWSSDESDVAEVDQTGIVKGKTEGVAIITASLENGEKATCEVTVTSPVHIESIEIAPSQLTMKNKTSETLQLIINPQDTTDDTTAQWSSNDEHVATVNQSGTVTAKGEGVVTITVKVGGFTADCQITVGPAATIEEMVSNEKYNISLNKNVIISTIYAGQGSQDESTLVNGDLTDEYVSTDWDNSRDSEYIIIDLGANYNTEGLDLIAMQFKEDPKTFCKDYEIQYSSNGFEYVTVAEKNGVEYDSTENGLLSIKVGDASDKIANTRYVRINMAGHEPWGYQIREAAVLSTDQNASTVEVAWCDNPADFIVTSDNLCEITYTIVAGENQEEYTYMVYLDGKQVGENVKAGTYTLKNIPKGTYELGVVSHYDGNISQGIKKTVTVDDGSLRDFVDTERNLARKGRVTVENIETGHNEGSEDPETIIDGNLSGKVVETVWGDKNATITIDLLNSYSKEQIFKILLAFKEDNTYASDYTIQFSGNGSDYEDVAIVEDAKYSELFETEVDTSLYTQETVRYVRIVLKDGAYNWGYQLYEIAVISGEDYSPVDGINVSKDVNVEGYQISSSFIGSKVVGSVEPEINGQTVKKWGLIYGIIKVANQFYEVKDSDMYYDAENAYVATYESTPEGTIDAVMGKSESAIYFARTMKFSANNATEFSAEYKVRAYAELEDGSYVYSDVSEYSVFKVAAILYNNRLMNTYDGHQYLYNSILKVVDSGYEQVDYQWSNTVVRPDEISTTTDLQVTGYQMTANLDDIEGKMGIRVVYQAEETIQDQTPKEVGLVYGLVYGDNPITEEDMLYGSENKYVQSYAATEKGKLDAIMGNSKTAAYYVRTMELNGKDGHTLNSVSAYTTTYLVRAYAKLNDDSIVYSDVSSYTVFKITDYLCQNQMVRTKSAWDCFYTNILKYVDNDYVIGDFNWSKTIVK